MSTINKKPFISKVLESLTSEQLTSLRGLVNGSTGPTFKSLINATYKITNSDKGVKHIILETANRTLSGYLLYNDSYCVLVSYALNSQELAIFKINLTNSELEPIDEYLDIDELRTLLDDSLIDGKVEALSSTGLKRLVVTELPTGSAIQTNVIYLVPAQDTSTGNIYDEYLYVSDGWEKIGSSATSGGSGVEVVELSSSSGTLTDADYTKVNGDNCVIKYSNDLYRKESDNGTKIVYSVEVGSTNNIADKVIEITISTKAYTTDVKYFNKVSQYSMPIAWTYTALQELPYLTVSNQNYYIEPAGEYNAKTIFSVSADDLATLLSSGYLELTNLPSDIPAGVWTPSWIRVQIVLGNQSPLITFYRNSGIDNLRYGQLLYNDGTHDYLLRFFLNPIGSGRNVKIKSDLIH